ncbi:pyridoxal phosphate-dependent aminotransferase family protein [Dokdonia sp.]|uniref:aminotransferase class I/II-fold pyridoxal phosphate-dependent enzyme n=1 Tax=Dokdonia sp. TaxID=2024995 RepID=UPI003267D9DD
MHDIFKKTYENKGPIGNWKNKIEGSITFPELTGKVSNRMFYKGQECINWSSNNYLGLANHPEVTKVEIETVNEWGGSYPMGSRMMTGETSYHKELERKLATFVNKEAAFVTNIGYQAMLSCIDALVDKNDIIIYDAECHACIVDGVRLHVGQHYAFSHNNVDALEQNLKRAEKRVDKTGGGILVITEGIFGIQGEQGKLKEIIALKASYNFRVMVDDAHGFGTMGHDGSGTGTEQGIQDHIDIYYSTFTKSMASMGAFITADSNVIDYLKYNMRSQIFSRTLPLLYVLGAIKRLDIMRNTPELRNKLWANTQELQTGFKNLGYDIGKTNSCVTPLYLSGDIVKAIHLVEKLRKDFSIFCSMVAYPVVPKKLALLRVIPTATHTKEDIEETLYAFSKPEVKSMAFTEEIKQQ